MKKITSIILLVGMLCQLSCQKDDHEFDQQVNEPVLSNFTPDFGANIKADFMGKVINEQGANIANVQITIGNKTVYTDHNGIFLVEQANAFEDFAYVKAYKSGYINGSRAVIPSTDGINDIQITLVKERVTAVVSAGSESQVTLDNGATVYFGGGFIDAAGNPYTGDVKVVTHYLTPGEEETYTEMPGMLLAQDNGNNLRSLETYGMLSVNLYTPGGSPVNIDPTSKATLEFPVDASQTGIAPEKVPLWYFDEEKGLWVEDGEVIRTGDKYIGEVSHFTWWNVDIPMDYVSVCFTLQTSYKKVPYHYIEIIRNSTGQTIYAGVTNDGGRECGLLPKGEEVTVKVYGQLGCEDAIILEQVEGPFNSDAHVTINVTSNPYVKETTISGEAKNCNGDVITSGYAYFFNNNTDVFVSIDNGNISYDHLFCVGEKMNVVIFDSSTSQLNNPVQVDLLQGETPLELSPTCNNSLGHHEGTLRLESQEDIQKAALFGYTSTDDLIIGTPSPATDIIDLSPLNTLTKVTNHIKIFNNTNLASLAGLDNIDECDILSVTNNPLLTSLQGLGEIRNLNIAVVSQNHAVTSLKGLDHLTGINRLIIYGNSSLQTITDLNNLSKINDELMIFENGVLASLEGLQGVAQIGGNLTLINNHGLDDVYGLRNITNVGGSVKIKGNNGMTSLHGLDRLETVDRGIQITSNANLISLDGLSGLKSTGANNPLEIGRSMYNEDLPNEKLTDFCGIKSLLNSGNHGVVFIGNNAYNPSVSDIKLGNCSQ